MTAVAADRAAMHDAVDARGRVSAERFSFYGMRSILIVFMTQYIVNRMGQPDHMGPAEARQNFALFVSAVYFLPIFGILGRIQIDCCNQCRGVFLDKGELESALVAVRGTTIDSVLALAASMSVQA